MYSFYVSSVASRIQSDKGRHIYPYLTHHWPPWMCSMHGWGGGRGVPDPPLAALDVLHGWGHLDTAEPLRTQHLLAFPANSTFHQINNNNNKLQLFGMMYILFELERKFKDKKSKYIESDMILFCLCGFILKRLFIHFF